VLTNSIQSSAVLPGSPTGPTVPVQSAAPGASSFANTLQSAGALPTETSNPQPAMFPGRLKSAEKKTPENSKPTALVSSSPETVPAGNGDVKPDSAIAINLQPNQTLPQEIGSSIATAELIPPPAESSGSDAKAGLAAGTGASKQDTVAGLASEFNRNAPAHNWGTVLEDASTTAAFDSGEQTPTREIASPPNTATASTKEVVPHPADTVRPALTPLAQSEAVQPAVSKVTLASNFSSPESAGTLPPDLAAWDVLIQGPSAYVAEAAGIAAKGDSHPVPANSNQGAGPHVMHPADVMTDVPSGANPLGGDSKSQPSVGSRNETPSTFSLASALASPLFSVETSKPISARQGTATKAMEPIPAPDVHSKEVSGTRASSNQEGAKLKPADSPANPADANVQPALAGPPPVSLTGQSSNGVQPSAAATTANVLAQVLPEVAQDSASRSAASPPTESQPAPSPSTPLPPAGTVEGARLVTGAAQSEMHIELRTQAFGSVEVHTVVRDSQVGLTVGSERGDLRTLLANEVSSLQTALRQQDLRFDNIRFLETSSGATAGFSSGADSQTRSSNQQHFSTGGLFSIHSPPDDPPELEIGAGIRARLNVHA
jgi:hypothetical protein